jgi:5-methylcytosine-specific restriction endonuclease McrBC GTP-binding regulatory subunit McrB
MSGKNVVLYGPLGIGKTKVALQLCERFLNGKVGEAYDIVTATAEWTYSDMIKGYEPKDGSFTLKEGILTKAVRLCLERLKNKKGPYWLVIDELNRANLDLALGSFFTLLDIDYRSELPLLNEEDCKAMKCPFEPLYIPYSFRIIATMNAYDRSLLLPLGFAFMRRFAFIKVPSKIAIDEEIQSVYDQEIKERYEEVQKIFNEAVEWLNVIGRTLKKQIIDAIKEFGKLRNDEYADYAMLKNIDLDEVIGEQLNKEQSYCLKIGNKDLDFIDLLLILSRVISKLKIAEIGLAMIIDAVKFVAVYLAKSNSKIPLQQIMDEAINAYILPQFEFIMPALRKEKVLGTSDIESRWKILVSFAGFMGLKRTAKVLEAASKKLSIML